MAWLTAARYAAAPYARPVPEQPPAPEDDPAGQGRRLVPLDPPMVPFALGGMLAFGLAGLVLLALRGTLAAHGRTEWLWICLAGFLWGIPGLLAMLRHDANRRRRRARAGTPAGPGATPDRPGRG